MSIVGTIIFDSILKYVEELKNTDYRNLINVSNCKCISLENTMVFIDDSELSFCEADIKTIGNALINAFDKLVEKYTTAILYQLNLFSMKVPKAPEVITNEIKEMIVVITNTIKTIQSDMEEETKIVFGTFGTKAKENSGDPNELKYFYRRVANFMYDEYLIKCKTINEYLKLFEEYVQKKIQRLTRAIELFE